MKNLREKLEAMGWGFVGKNDSGMVEFNGYPEEVDPNATLELVKNGYIEEYNYIDNETCEEETMLILKIYPKYSKAKLITWEDSIDAYLERNSEETIINQEIEAAAEESILSERELEQLKEEMLDELYQKQYDEEKRKEAYKKIAEYLWHKGAPADIYESWLNICVEEGVF